MNYRILFLVGLWTGLWLSLPAVQAQESGDDGKTQRMFEQKIREAAAAFDREDFATSEKLTAEAEALIPNDANTINLRGSLLFKKKRYDEALEIFQQLIERNPNSYPGYFNTAEVYLAQKKYDLALTGFERILDARRGDEVVQFRIALVLALMGRLDDARARAAKIPNPGQTAAYYYANAAIELVAGNQKKGLQLIEKSEVFFPAATSVALRAVLVENGLLKK